MQLYPLPAAHLGVEHVTILDHVALGTALSIPRLNEAPVLMEVTLEANPLNHWWKVRSPFGIIGFLDAQESAEFPDLDRVLASQLNPATWATAEIIDGDIEIAVHLGLNVWSVPRNNQPAGSVLFNGGQGYLLDTSVADDLDEYQLAAMGTCQLITTVTAVGEHLVATIGDVALGAVRLEDVSAGLADVVRQAQQQGTVVCARAYVASGCIAVDLPAADSAELFAATLPQVTTPHDAPIIPPKESELPHPLEFEFSVDAEDFASHSPAPRGPRAISSAFSTSPPSGVPARPVPAGEPPVGGQPLETPEASTKARLPEREQEQEQEPELDSELDPQARNMAGLEPEAQGKTHAPAQPEALLEPTTASEGGHAQQLVSVAELVNALAGSHPPKRSNSESARVRQRRQARRRRRGHHRR